MVKRTAVSSSTLVYGRAICCFLPRCLSSPSQSLTRRSPLEKTPRHILLLPPRSLHPAYRRYAFSPALFLLLTLAYATPRTRHAADATACRLPQHCATLTRLRLSPLIYYVRRSGHNGAAVLLTFALTVPDSYGLNVFNTGTAICCLIPLFWPSFAPVTIAAITVVRFDSWTHLRYYNRTTTTT